MRKIISGDFKYEIDTQWGRNLTDVVTGGFGMRKVSGLASDAADNIYLLTRSDKPIIVTDKDGNFLYSMGEGHFDNPHGVTLDDEGNLYCVDVSGHMVHKFSPEGELEMTLGTRGQPSDTGAVIKPGEMAPDYRTVKRAAGPFNAPNNLAIAPNGDLYIADGYGNASVHRFTAQGAYIQSWGEPGNLPGQFYMPHGILVGPNGIVYVADRENNRIQLFDLYGHFMRSWDFIERPSHMVLGADNLVYVCECKKTNLFDDSPSAIRIVTLDGEEVARFDNGVGSLHGGDYRAAHAICVDRSGNILIGDAGQVPLGHFGLHRYVRV